MGLRTPWTSKNQIFSILLKFYMEVGDDGLRLGIGFGGLRGLLEGSGDSLDLKKYNFFDFAQILHGG